MAEPVRSARILPVEIAFHQFERWQPSATLMKVFYFMVWRNIGSFIVLLRGN